VPQGYYTIEQWKRPDWVAVAVLPFGLTQTAAEQALERMGAPGLYRLVHTQRIIWAERDGAGMRLRKSHASSPQNLANLQDMFDRAGGRYPVDEVRADRRERKRKKG
jgi:hypothetical protein